MFKSLSDCLLYVCSPGSSAIIEMFHCICFLIRPLIYWSSRFCFFHSLHFGVFQDIFWRLKTHYPEKIVVSCPDVMFNTYFREIPDKRYVDLARKWDVKKWVESSGRVRWYGCRRGHSHTSSDTCSFNSGIGVPPCDLENLADAIKFVMKECEDAGLFCEFQEGTLLGNFNFLCLAGASSCVGSLMKCNFPIAPQGTVIS